MKRSFGLTFFESLSKPFAVPLFFERSSIFIHEMIFLKPRVLFKINRLQILNTRQRILYTPYCTSLLKSIKCIPLDEFVRHWAW